ALAQTGGMLVMRMADADLMPYDFTALAQTVRQYATQVKTLLKNRTQEAQDRDRNLKQGLYRLASDPENPTVPPPSLEIPPALNFSALDQAMAALDKSAQHYKTAAASHPSLPAASLKAVNRELAQAEQKLLSPQGLPRR